MRNQMATQSLVVLAFLVGLGACAPQKRAPEVKSVTGATPKASPTPSKVAGDGSTPPAKGGETLAKMDESAALSKGELLKPGTSNADLIDVSTLGEVAVSDEDISSSSNNESFSISVKDTSGKSIDVKILKKPVAPNEYAKGSSEGGEVLTNGIRASFECKKPGQWARDCEALEIKLIHQNSKKQLVSIFIARNLILDRPTLKEGGELFGKAQVEDIEVKINDQDGVLKRIIKIAGENSDVRNKPVTLPSKLMYGKFVTVTVSGLEIKDSRGNEIKYAQDDFSPSLLNNGDLKIALNKVIDNKAEAFSLLINMNGATGASPSSTASLDPAAAPVQAAASAASQGQEPPASAGSAASSAAPPSGSAPAAASPAASAPSPALSTSVQAALNKAQKTGKPVSYTASNGAGAQAGVVGSGPAPRVIQRVDLAPSVVSQNSGSINSGSDSTSDFTFSPTNIFTWMVNKFQSLF